MTLFFNTGIINTNFIWAMASNSKVVRVEGTVEESLPNLLFRVRTRDNEELLAYLAGRLKLHRIQVIAGDKVIVEMPVFEKKKGRIIRRL